MFNLYECSICGNATVHDAGWDAYACISCNRWQEEVCGDEDCILCAGRPPKPVPEA